jgi:hypothetical protein
LALVASVVVAATVVIAVISIDTAFAVILQSVPLIHPPHHSLIIAFIIDH